MKPETQERVIGAVVTLVLAGLGVFAYSLGATDLGAALVGGALGYGVQRRSASGDAS